MCRVICLAITFSLFLGNLSQAQDWAEAYHSSVAALGAGDPDLAITKAGDALNFFVKDHGENHKNIAIIHRQLALAHFEKGDLSKALFHAMAEVKKLETLGMTDDYSFGSALYNTALVHNARSEYPAAEKLFEAARAIYVGYIEEDVPELLLLDGNYGVCLFHLGKDEEAGQRLSAAYSKLQALGQFPSDFFNIAYNYSAFLREKGRLRESLEPLEAVLGYYEQLSTPEYGNVLNNMADSWQQLGNFRKAEELLLSSKGFFEGKQLDKNGAYLLTLNLLARNYQHLGGFAEAEEILTSLLAKSDTTNSEINISNVVTYINLGGLAFLQGEFKNSEKWYEKAAKEYDSRQPADETLVKAFLGGSSACLKAREVVKASDYLSRADSTLRLLRAASKETEIAMSRQQAAVWLAEGKLTEARNLLEEASQTARSLWGEESQQSGGISSLLGVIYRDMANYSAADKHFKTALRAFEKVYGTSHPEYGILMGNYATLKQLDGSMTEAETYLKTALSISESHFGTHNPDYIISLENLATLYMQMGRYPEAGEHYQTALTNSLTLFGKKSIGHARSLRNLGVLKRALGEYGESEKLLRESIGIVESVAGKTHLVYADYSNDLGLLYLSLGNLTAAKPLFEVALHTYEANYGKNHPEYATTLENISTIYQMEGNNEKALPLLENALKIDEMVLGKNHPLYSKTLHNLAALYQENEDFDKAERLYKESLLIYEGSLGKNHASYASTVYNLAVLLQDMERLDEAQSYFQEALAIRSRLFGEGHPDYAFTLFGLASVMQQQKKWSDAFGHYKQVLEKYGKQIAKVFPALSEEEKSAFYAKIRPVYVAFQDFGVEFTVLQQGSPEERDEMLRLLYDVQLLTKALLLNATNKVRSRILAGGDTTLIHLFNNWKATKELLVKAYSYSIEELNRNQIDIKELEIKANDIEKVLSEKSSLFADEFDKGVITWLEVKNKLGPDAAAVEILRIKKNIKNDSVIYAALILHGQPEKPIELVFYPNGRELEEKAFRKHRNAIMYKIKDGESFELYWKPIAEKLAGENNVYLSSDGIFNKINLNTLLNSAQQQYLVEHANIHLLSNTRDLAERLVGGDLPHTATLFGFPDYELSEKPLDMDVIASAAFAQTNGLRDFENGITALPGTLKEINSLSSILTEKGWVFHKKLAAEASEENFKSVGSSTVLHIATHGFFLEDFALEAKNNVAGIQSKYARFNPLFRSGVLLAGASKSMKDQKAGPSGEDGVLTAYEVMNLNLEKTELVILSACETGLGEVRNGEGVYGLQRAFIVAGAKTIVMSLWKVDDEVTQKLMTRFYTYWLETTEKYAAFKSAVQDIKKEYPEPYFWGAFVMLGE